jgi:hypothetical protein
VVWQSSSVRHPALHTAAALPTCRQTRPSHSSAGLDMVTVPVPVPGTPTSHGPPTAAGCAHPPADATTIQAATANGAKAECADGYRDGDGDGDDDGQSEGLVMAGSDCNRRAGQEVRVLGRSVGVPDNPVGGFANVVARVPL